MVAVTGGATGPRPSPSGTRRNMSWASSSCSRTGRGAKVIYNTQLIEVAEQVVVFWDGKNKGVAEAIARAGAKGIPVEVVRFR